MARRSGSAKLWATGGGVAAAAVVGGVLVANVTLGAIDPHYRYAERWRASARIERVEPGPTQPAVGTYASILPWEMWATPSPPAARDVTFQYDDAALLGPADAHAAAEVDAKVARVAYHPAAPEPEPVDAEPPVVLIDPPLEVAPDVVPAPEDALPPEQTEEPAIPA